MSDETPWTPNALDAKELGSWFHNGAPQDRNVSSISIEEFISGNCDGVTVMVRHCVSIPVGVFKDASFKSLSVNCGKDEFITRDLIEGLKVNTSLKTLNVVSPYPYLVNELSDAIKASPSITLLGLNATSGITSEGSCLAGVVGSIIASNTVITGITVPHIHWGVGAGPKELVDAIVGSSTITDVTLSSGYLGIWSIGDDRTAGIVRIEDDPPNHSLLVRMITGATSVTTLDLVDMHLDTEELGRIIRALAFNTSIENMDMSRCSTGLDDMETVGMAVAEVLKWNTSIVELCLSEVKIGKKGLVRIADSLIRHKALRSLILDKTVSKDAIPNDIDDMEVGDAFMTVLNGRARDGTGSRLEVLDLGHNNIGPSGLCVLVSGLKENAHLRYLNITMCAIDHSYINNTGAAIGDAISVNATLQHLSMCGIPLDTGGAESIGEALKMNTGLKHLHAIGNCAGAHLEYEVTGALEHWNHTLVSAWMDVGRDQYDLRRYITRNQEEAQDRLEAGP